MSDKRMKPREILAALGLTAGLLTAQSGAASAAECWQGWGYWVDAQTRAYKSEELLLVTDGPADWVIGRPVTLFLMDRVTGEIDRSRASLVAVPIDTRSYYRGNANYVDGSAAVRGADDRLVFGLSHVSPPASALPEMEAYTAWACGLGRRKQTN
jgi:hypothetical protein